MRRDARVDLVTIVSARFGSDQCVSRTARWCGSSQDLQAIRSTADRLRDYPRIGRALDEPYRLIGVRTTPYLIVYRLAGGGVEIVRIRHGREDWLSDVEADL